MACPLGPEKVASSGPEVVLEWVPGEVLGEAAAHSVAGSLQQPGPGSSHPLRVSLACLPWAAVPCPAPWVSAQPWAAGGATPISRNHRHANPFRIVAGRLYMYLPRVALGRWDVASVRQSVHRWKPLPARVTHTPDSMPQIACLSSRIDTSMVSSLLPPSVGRKPGACAPVVAALTVNGVDPE